MKVSLHVHVNSQVVLCDIIFIRTIFNTQIGLDILTYWSKLVCSSRVKPQVSQYLQFTQGSHQTYTVVNCIIFQCRLQALWKEGRRPNETVIGTDIYVLSEYQEYQARIAKFICTDINWISIILSQCDHNVKVFLTCLLYLSCKQTIWEHQGQGWGWELIEEGNYFTYKLIIMKHHKPTPHVQFSPSMSFQTEVQVMNEYIST